MLSKNQARFIQSLGVKKIREKSGLYIAEGEKIVAELLQDKKNIKHIFATPVWIKENKKEIGGLNTVEVTQAELKKISSLTTPNEVLAVVQIPFQKLNIKDIINRLSIVLDDIRDPGNLGTIIRIADWFGIDHVVCSKQTADCYNSKVVQAAMGSLQRVKIYYTDIEKFIEECNAIKLPVYATLLEGENIFSQQLDSVGVIIIGNESNGVSTKIKNLASKKINIPAYTKNKGAESLNAAIATAIVCAEFRRQSAS